MKSKCLLLLLISIGFIPLARGQEPVIVQKASTNGNTTVSAVTVTSGGTFGGAPGGLIDPSRMMREVQDATQAAMQEAISNSSAAQSMAFGGAGFFPGTLSPRRAEGPALLVSRPMDFATRTAWQEDLRVMDKLLRDQISKVDGDDARQAMGIRLRLTDKAQTAPVLIDALGVVFSYEASFPLAASGKPASGGVRPGNPATAWDRARSELQGGTTSGSRPGSAVPSSVPGSGTAFKQDKLDALINAVIGVLLEARNIRHLASTAAVYVSVAGADDAGTSARLTLKTTKHELEKAGSNALSPAELRKLVVWSVQ